MAFGDNFTLEDSVGSGGSTTPATLSSIDIADGKTCLVIGTNYQCRSGNTNGAITDTQTLTWTRIGSNPFFASFSAECAISMWIYHNDTGSTISTVITVTRDPDNNDGGKHSSCVAYTFDGEVGTVTNYKQATATNGNPSVTLDTTPASSSLVIAAYANSLSTAITGNPTGFTEDYDANTYIMPTPTTRRNWQGHDLVSPVSSAAWTAGSGNALGVIIELPEGGSSTDVLTSNDLTAGTPSLDTPALTQEHVLTSSDLVAGTPTLDTPALSEIVALTADDITAGTPELDTPALGAIYNLTATELETTPVIDSITIGQTHVLTPTELSTTPVLDTPAITQEHALTADDLVAGTPVLDSPLLGQVHDLTSNDLSASAPSLDTPVIGQEHALNIDDLVAGTPELDTPILGIVGGTHALTADDILAGTPVLDTPFLTVPGSGQGGGRPSVSIGIGI